MEQELIFEELKEAYNHASTEDAFIELKEKFEALGDFEKAPDYVKKIDNILAYSKGNLVTFGHFNGQDLEWKVLAVKGRERLLLLNSVIPNVLFAEERENAFWKDSYLQKWLNSKFLSEAFTLKEKMNIIFTNNKNPANDAWGTLSGPDTRDKIFALSHDEIKFYLPEEKDRAMGEWYWLRTLGHCSLSAETVYIDGTIYDIGISITDPHVGVRPAMWLRLGR